MGWEKLRTCIGTDELWELESKKKQQQYYIIYVPLINRMGKTVNISEQMSYGICKEKIQYRTEQTFP